MLNDDSLYLMRLQAMSAADQLGSVALACRVLDIPRSTFYRWRKQWLQFRTRDPAPTRAPNAADAERNPALSAADVLDVRSLPPPLRHGLTGGAAITLVNDHDPKPLHYQLDAAKPGQFSWDYLEEGPQAWRVRIARIA